MCTFLSTFDFNQKGSVASSGKRNIYMAMRPCDPNDRTQCYRFRLLNFNPPSSHPGRTTPWIEVFEHVRWGKNEQGKPVIESRVVCPMTKFAQWEGDRRDCPICKFAGNNFAAYKESGKTNKELWYKSRDFQRKFAAYIPVYVVNDPNYEKNNGQLKVISFNDRDEYKKLVDIVMETSRNVLACNGKQAVDLCIRPIRKQVTENGATFMKNMFDYIKFTNKPYDIPAITHEAIDAFPYDETYYVTSTKHEIDEFYNKYCKVQRDDFDVPEETVEVFSKPAATSQVQTAPAPAANPAPQVQNPVVTETKSEKVDLGEIDDIINEPPAPAKKEPETAKAPADITPMPMDQNVDDIDVDDLLAGI